MLIAIVWIALTHPFTDTDHAARETMWLDVCMTEKWSPALQIRTVLLSIQALLSAPNPDDPLANDVAEQWKVNEAQAIETGRCLFWAFLLGGDFPPPKLIIPPPKQLLDCVFWIFLQPGQWITNVSLKLSFNGQQHRKLFAIKHSKVRKFMSKMQQNTFGGQALPRPAGELMCSPRPLATIRGA